MAGNCDLRHGHLFHGTVSAEHKTLFAVFGLAVTMGMLAMFSAWWADLLADKKLIGPLSAITNMGGQGVLTVFLILVGYTVSSMGSMTGSLISVLVVFVVCIILIVGMMIFGGRPTKAKEVNENQSS